MRDTIFMYPRRRNGQRATLVSKKVNNQIFIGWSKTHKNDAFNKEMGKRVAIARLNKVREGKNKEAKLPFLVQETIMDFVNRSKKFFKSENVRVYGME